MDGHSASRRGVGAERAQGNCAVARASSHREIRPQRAAGVIISLHIVLVTDQYLFRIYLIPS